MLFPDQIRRKLRIQYTLKHHKHHKTHLDCQLVPLVCEKPNWYMNKTTINTKQIGKIREILEPIIQYNEYGQLHWTLPLNKNNQISKKKNCFYYFKIHYNKIVKITIRKQPCSLQMAERIIQGKPR